MLVHLLAGELLEFTGARGEAEREFRISASIIPDATNQMALAGIARGQGHIDEECAFWRKAVDLVVDQSPILLLQLLSDAEMRARHPERALAALDCAISLLPPPGACRPCAGSGSGSAAVAMTEGELRVHLDRLIEEALDTMIRCRCRRSDPRS